MPLRGENATAWQQMEGFRPLHDGQGGRFRTASLHSPAAPEITTIHIWLIFCRAMGSQIWAVLPRFALAGIPASSTPAPDWRWVSQRLAGGDQGD